jgi:iron complex outermembrane receptor protein
MQRLFILLVFIITSFNAFPQLHGTVFDAENQQPIEGVRITHNGKVLTLTNSRGEFSLDNISFNDTLRFARIGYQKLKEAVGKDTTMNIYLQSKSIAIENVTVRAYSTRQEAFKASGALEVLNAQQINRMSVTSPETVFNSMPGMYMHKGARNTNRITIRGIGSRSMYTTTKVKAYLNEIPLTSGIGETTIEDLDLDLIDRITVLKGPSSSVYGAALGGTILYKMGMPANKGLNVLQKSSVGSFNQFQNTSHVSWKGNKTGLRIAYNKLNSKGFRKNDDYTRDALTAFFEHQLTENTKISYLGRFHNLKAYIPSSLSEETFQNNPGAADTGWDQVNGHERYNKTMNGVSINTALNSQLELTSSLYAKIYNGREIRPFNILDDQSTTTGTRNILQWERAYSNVEFTIETGFESLYETYQWDVFETLAEGDQGAKLSKNNQVRTHHNLFTALDIQWKNWKLSTGGNVNKTRYTYNDLFTDSVDFSDSKHFDWIFSPRVSLTWQPKKGVLFYGNLSHGFSSPSYEETLNAEGYVTGNIKPETGWNREIGIRLRGRENNWYAKISGYMVAVDNLLVTKRIAEDEFYKINAGKTSHQGLEILGRVRWLNSQFLKSTFHTSYMYSNYRFEEFTDEGNDYSGNALPGIPSHKAYIQLDLNFDAGIYLTANMLWSDIMPLNDANSKYSNAFLKTALKAGFRKTLSRKWRVNIFAGIQNLNNEHYASMILINAPSYGGSAPRYYYPGAPRNYHIGLSLRYSIF